MTAYYCSVEIRFSNLCSYCRVSDANGKLLTQLIATGSVSKDELRSEDGMYHLHNTTIHGQSRLHSLPRGARKVRRMPLQKKGIHFQSVFKETFRSDPHYAKYVT